MENKKYIITTDFDWEENKKAETFEKELELLCIRYDLKLDYETIHEDIY